MNVTMLLIIVLHGYTLICLVMQNKYAKNPLIIDSISLKVLGYMLTIFKHCTVFNEEAYELIY